MLGRWLHGGPRSSSTRPAEGRRGRERRGQGAAGRARGRPRADAPTRSARRRRTTACRRCRPPRSGRSRRRPRSARPGPACAPGTSPPTTTRPSCGPKSTGSSPCRKRSAWTCWCTASPSATTWSSTSPSSSTGTPPPTTAGSSRYGTRYVRPPILHGDVSRPRPMTVGWARYAQSRTEQAGQGHADRAGRPCCRGRSSATTSRWPTTARQVALAVSDEIADLEAAGIRDHPGRRARPARAAAAARGPTATPTWPGRSGRSGWPPSGCGRRHPDPHPHVLQRVRRDHRRDRGASTPTSSRSRRRARGWSSSPT